MSPLLAIKDEILDVCEDDSAFIDYCNYKFDSLGNIDHWQLVSDTAAEIKASAGLNSPVTQRAIPLVTGENYREPFVCLIFTGTISSSLLHLGLPHGTTDFHNSKKTVSTSNFSTVSKVLQGNLSHTRYKSNIDFPSQIRSRDIYEELRLSAPECKTLKAGDILVQDRRDTIIVRDEISPSVALVICNPKKKSNYQYHFKKETGQLSRISEFEPKISRKEKAIRILEKYGNTSSLPALMAASEDGRHTIRWLALRAMIRLDPKKKNVYLQKGACDDNKDIREACEKLMKRHECA
ncbi:HEAT repeat domain-containing protein [Xanthomonas fragariae]|uniref:Uncharacterized protein n=1 Tax=Xanthomonas fragariae TaxID=48664 RepID=A0A1Y6HKB5_9XANT|nr:HEAT repeat domain-containing protein [Xanthomonas fragariae]AOD14145.1 hypothetical protein BER92_04650 [Xanthomonas fragariae]ENZ94334.1 hypothetical protein O1K_16081 [Xanthomonas fragariae LMG 25863]MBL9197897.1 HEAT repeat domain-containing protein [Xanthomonas fragariae]MBL9220005.1 HEAT repeat domain-containing protein [Xanthomonas fragariae]MDM7572260.1 HEAT repeat domain-containing protein [Xanthomonas fragariae]